MKTYRLETYRLVLIILSICVLAVLAAAPLPANADPDGRAHCEHIMDHDPTDPGAMFDPPVRIIVFGAPANKGVFTVKLIGTDPNCPMPEESDGREKTITVLGGEVSRFGTWSYREAGVYHYSVYLLDTGKEGYIYDTEVYTITDVVKHEGSELSINRVITNKMNKPVDSMCFMNKYEGQSSYLAFGPDGSIIETRTETGRDNIYYYVMMGIGAALGIVAAYDLIRTYMKPSKSVRYERANWGKVRFEA